MLVGIKLTGKTRGFKWYRNILFKASFCLSIKAKGVKGFKKFHKVLFCNRILSGYSVERGGLISCRCWIFIKEINEEKVNKNVTVERKQMQGVFRE